MLVTPTVELEPRSWLSGLCFPKSPRWERGQLWFSDIVRNTVLVAAPDSDAVREVFGCPGPPSSTGFRPDGSVLVVSMDEMTVARRAGDEFEALADFSGQGWRYLNDMIIDPQTGIAYIDALSVVDGAGAIVLLRPDGSTAVAGRVAHPNGMTLLPGTRELLVSDVYSEAIRSFTIGPDGTLAPSGTFAVLPGRHPHGLCADAEGGVWVTAYLTGEVLRLDRGGRITHRIRLARGRWAMTCELGGVDGSTLFIASVLATANRDACESEGWIDTVVAPVGVAAVVNSGGSQ